MNPIFVKVGNVCTHETPQVLFVQRDHVVQHLAPTATHPSFSDSILPRRSDTRPFRLQSRGLQEGDDLVIECRITIEDRVPIRTSFGERLTQLLDHPLRSRVTGYVAVQNPAPSMFDHEEAVEDFRLRTGGRVGTVSLLTARSGQSWRRGIALSTGPGTGLSPRRLGRAKM